MRGRSRSPRRTNVSDELSAEAQEFVMRNGLDDKCLEDIMSLPEDMMREVLAINIDGDCRNPSAVVTTRIGQLRRRFQGVGTRAIGDMRDGGSSRGGGGGGRFTTSSISDGGRRGAPMGSGRSSGGSGLSADLAAQLPPLSPPNIDDVEWFCQYNGINESVKKKMTTYGDGIIEYLTHECPQFDATTEESVKNSRMAMDVIQRTAQSKALDIRCRVHSFLRDIGPGVSDAAKEQFLRASANNQAQIILKNLDGGFLEDNDILDSLDAKGNGNGSAIVDQGGAMPMGIDDETLEQFCDENGLDDRARKVLQECHADVLDLVMQEGGVSAEAKNPSAVMLSRVRRAKESIDERRGRNRRGGGSVMAVARGQRLRPEEVEDFILNSAVDERARKVFMDQPEDLQIAIINDGPIENTMNPSAILMSRLKRHREEQKQMGGRGGDRFDDRGRGGFDRGFDRGEIRGRGMAMNIPERNRGGSVLRGVTNDPELLSQIKDFCNINGLDDRVMGMLQQSPDGTIEALMSEGPFPPDCKNTSAVIMSRMRKIGSNPHIPRCFCFLRENGIDEKAQQEFLDTPRDVQEMVLDRGELLGRNPSAIMMSRLRECRRGEDLRNMARRR